MSPMRFYAWKSRFPPVHGLEEEEPAQSEWQTDRQRDWQIKEIGEDEQSWGKSGTFCGRLVGCSTADRKGWKCWERNKVLEHVERSGKNVEKHWVSEAEMKKLIANVAKSIWTLWQYAHMWLFGTCVSKSNMSMAAAPDSDTAAKVRSSTDVSDSWWLWRVAHNQCSTFRRSRSSSAPIWENHFSVELVLCMKTFSCWNRTETNINCWYKVGSKDQKFMNGVILHFFIMMSV